MPFYTFVDNAVPTSSQWNANVRDQVVTQCTSATRPATPVEGQQIYETDTDRLQVWSGTAWVVLTEPIQTWTPSQVGQGVACTFTTTRAWSRRCYGIWEARAVLTITSAGTGGNTIAVTTPYTMVNANDASGFLVGSDAGTTTYFAAVRPLNTTQVRFTVDGISNYLGVNPGWTLANTDTLELWMTGTY